MKRHDVTLKLDRLYYSLLRVSQAFQIQLILKQYPKITIDTKTLMLYNVN